MNKLRLAALIFCVLMMTSAISAQEAGQGVEVFGQNILLIHSYHSGLKWTDDISAGVSAALGDRVNLFVEYMNTKHQYSEEYLELLSDLLEYKFALHNFQLIICSDNNAFNFLTSAGRKIFGYTPVVFCGLNYPEEALEKAGENITGVIEKVHFEENMRLITTLHPHAKELIFITDNTPTGQRLQEEFSYESLSFQEEFEKITVWYDFTMIELLTQLKTLSDDAVILFSLFFRDAQGTFYDWQQGTQLIMKASPVPVYGLWDFYLGQGVVGGKLISGYKQGFEAGEMAKRILAGTPVRKIPVRTSNPYTYAFDYTQLERFGLVDAELPEESIVINKPYSVIREYRNLFIAIFAVIIFLTVMVSLLIVNILLRHRAEKELRSARNYIVGIINSMPSIIVGVDRRGYITNWNLKAEQESTLSAEEAIGKRFNEVFSRFTEQMEKINSAIEQQKIEHILKTNGTKAQESRYEEIVVYPLIIEETEGAVIRVDDKTEQRKFEEMMIQNEKMLSLGGLAAGMAHEINNPLSAMVQNAQVAIQRLKTENPANRRAAEQAGLSLDALQAYVGDREIIQQLEMIREAGKHAKEIVLNMLNFAHCSDAGRSSHDILMLLDSTVELASIEFNLRKSTDFKRIKIEKKYASPIPMVPCEAGKIRQVFLNILRNGAAAMFERQKIEGNSYSPCFKLKVNREAEMVRIEISDNGIGIKQEIRSRIFEPFFTTKPVGEGTGLGLSISYFIITENHGGTMEVRSSAGEGSSFIIRLPTEGPRQSQTAAE
jgi:PAS domain S-box-containing protein